MERNFNLVAIGIILLVSISFYIRAGLKQCKDLEKKRKRPAEHFHFNFNDDDEQLIF